MFETLQESIGSALRSLSGKARLSEANMREVLGLVQNALLEADVSYQVAKDFVARVSDQAVGETVLKSLDPTKQLIGIVYNELVQLMGPVDSSLHLKTGDVTVLMMCGLQGSGKTTTCGKLARMIQRGGRVPMLVAADLQRPAAIEQLRVLGRQINVPVHAEDGAQDPVALCQAAVKRARSENVQVVILDTAGRLHIDQELMEQLKRIDRRVTPDQVYLVVDGMTGQDAVNSARAFNEALELDGVILTKLDGDARGGAALSVKAVTGVPVKFIGTGEHIDEFDEFNPERMAGRILGMGDVVSLVKQAQDKFDQETMARQEERLRKGEFTLDDFRTMLGQTSRLGPLNKVMSLIPGMGQMNKMLEGVDADGEMRQLAGVIDSMTPDERRDPSRIVDASRRRRIAAGAGVDPAMVNGLVKQFDGMKSLMKQMSSMGLRDRLKTMGQMQRGGMMDPGAMLTKPKGNTGKRLTNEERKKLKKDREREERRRKRKTK